MCLVQFNYKPYWVIFWALWLGACGLDYNNGNVGLNYNNGNIGVTYNHGGVGVSVGTDGTSVNVNIPTSATYSVEYVGEWSASRFATNFPAGDHFTTFVGATHNNQVQFWDSGQSASPALEIVAEQGLTSQMQNVVASAKTSGTADELILFNGLGAGSGTTTTSIVVNNTHPLVTMASMLAPSPDWFVGVHDVALYTNGLWQTRLEIPAKVYDAGTEDGTGFSLGNDSSDPHTAISLLTTPASATDFSEGVHRTSGATVGKFIFTLQ